MTSRAAGRGQIAGGPVGRPIIAPPGNRFTQPRIQPVNPPRPAAPIRSVEDIRASALRNSAPRLPQTRFPQVKPFLPPGRGPGFGPAPLPPVANMPAPMPENPLTQMPPPMTGGPDPIPDWITPPAEGSINTQVITPITNPVTGETYTAPTGGYGLNPSLFNPGAMTTMSDMDPSGMFNPQALDQARAFNRYYQEQTAGVPGYTSVAALKSQFNQLTPEQQMAYYRGPTSNLGAAVGTASPMLNTVQAGFNPRGAVGATSGY